ncbi:MAG: hypothetical protein ABI679_16380 [Gemmatimonadota bacterium]
MTVNPFDSERDEHLGAMLQNFFEPSDHPGFVRKVLAGVHATDTSWDVLGHWARPSVAAGLAFLMGVTVWLALKGPAEAPATLSEVMRPGNAPARLFSSARPDNELVLEVVLDR